MILFKKIKTEKSTHVSTENDDQFCLKDGVKIDDFVSEYIEKGEDALKLKIFPLKQLCEHVSNFTTKDDKDLISFYVDSYLSDLINTIPLTTENMIDENIEKSIEIFRSKDYVPTPRITPSIKIEKENILPTISSTKSIKKTTKRRGK
ncbi:hypothetical protein MXB_4716 [Myxobolus squamalis]|nr:hypothetical protein MXB_4716 [Myxobolus squamalis]